MNRFKDGILVWLSRIGVVLLAASLVLLFIAFLAVPGLMSRFEDTAKMLVDLLGLGGLSAYLAGKLKERIAKDGTISRGIVEFLKKEPIILAIVWIVVLAQPILYGYVFPIHSAHFTLIDSKSMERINPRIEDFQVNAGGHPYDINRAPNPAGVYTTKRFLNWGDSAVVKVKAEGFQTRSTYIPWQGNAIRQLFGSVTHDLYLQPEPPVVISVEADPVSAKIVANAGSMREATGVLRFEAPRGTRIEIRVSEAGYLDGSAVFIADSDSTVVLALDPKPVPVVFVAKNVGGVELSGYYIDIDGTRQPQKTGDAIYLVPRRYTVRLVSENGDLSGEEAVDVSFDEQTQRIPITVR
jgi:hypothetical protein